MKRDKKIWYWILCLIFFEALLFLYCNQVNPNLFMFEAFFLILGIAAVCFLTELLITWLIILSFALSIFVLVSGVVYLPLNDTLFLIFSFPLLMGILSKIKYYFYKFISSVQIEEVKASNAYRDLLGDKKPVQALLIHWSHEEQFFELSPREYNHLLTSIYHQISDKLDRFEQVFYVSEGSYLILSKNKSRNLEKIYKTSLEEHLKEMTFTWGSSYQGIQFQSGFLVMRIIHIQDSLSRLRDNNIFIMGWNYNRNLRIIRKFLLINLKITMFQPKMNT